MRQVRQLVPRASRKVVMQFSRGWGMSAALPPEVYLEHFMLAMLLIFWSLARAHGGNGGTVSCLDQRAPQVGDLASLTDVGPCPFI